MIRNIRIVIVLALVFGITALARNKIVWASGAANGVKDLGLAQLKVFLWDDANQNGLQDMDENGVPDAMVNLFDSTDTLIDVTITDEGGVSLFNNLPLGTYYVEIAPPDGYDVPLAVQNDAALVENNALNTVVVKTVVKTLVAGENSQIWDTGLYETDLLHNKPKSGTVKPPPRFIKVCKAGNYSVGGVAELKVTNLDPSYCLAAFLWNQHFGFGHIPTGAGKFLADITFVQVFHYSRFVATLPINDGKSVICYALPPGKQAQIYFYDFNGLHFGKHNPKPDWTVLPTTIESGIACAPAQDSGAYALIGK